MSKLKLKANNKQGYYIYEIGGVLDLNYISSTTRRGRVQSEGKISPTICSENPELCRIEEAETEMEVLALDEQNMSVRKDIVGTLTTDGSSPKHNNRIMEKEEKNYRYRIRKITPREAGRLMSFDDKDIDAMLSVNSNSQVYKQCGNSIVTDVLCYIFKNMIDEKNLHPKVNDNLQGE